MQYNAINCKYEINFGFLFCGSVLLKSGMNLVRQDKTFLGQALEKQTDMGTALHRFGKTV